MLMSWSGQHVLVTVAALSLLAIGVATWIISRDAR